MKDPKTCKEAVKVYGVYVCHLNCTPCKNVEKCPVEALNGLLQGVAEAPKGE